MKTMTQAKSDRVLDFKEKTESLKEEKSTYLLPQICRETTAEFEKLYSEAPSVEKKQLTRAFAQVIVYTAARAAEQSSVYKVQQITTLSEEMLDRLFGTTEGKYIPPEIANGFEKAATKLEKFMSDVSDGKKAAAKLKKCAHKYA